MKKNALPGLFLMTLALAIAISTLAPALAAEPVHGALAPQRLTDPRSTRRDRTVTAAMAPAKPVFLSITSWDPGLIVVTALRALGPDVPAERLRAYLATIKKFVGVNGPYDMAAVPNRGSGLSAVYIVRYDGATNSFIGVSKAGGEPAR